MSNGDSQKIDFTVKDSNRLARIESKLDAFNGFKNVFESYQNSHNKEHDKIDTALEDRISKKGLKWALGIIGSIILIGGSIFAIVG